MSSSTSRVLILGLAIAVLSVPLTGCIGTTGGGSSRPDSGDAPQRRGPSAASVPAGYRCAFGEQASDWSPCDRPVSDGESETVEPVIAANPQDPDHLVVSTMQRGVYAPEIIWSGLYHTENGDDSWNFTPIPRQGTPLASYVFGGDNDVEILPGGTVVHAGSAYRYGGSYTDATVYVARSTDGGESFQDVTIVAPGAGKILNEQVDIEVDPSTGTVFAAWTRQIQDPTYRPQLDGPLPITQIRVAKSTDGGKSFSDPVTVTETKTNTGWFPSLAVEPEERVVVGWSDHSRGYMIATSTDGGASFSKPAVAAPAPDWPETSLEPSSRVKLVAEPSPGSGWGTLHAILPLEPPGGGSGVLGHVTSSDGGSNWSEPEKLPLGLEDSGEGWPTLTIGPNGTLHTLYYQVHANDTLMPTWAAKPVDDNWTEGRPLASAVSSPSNARAGLEDYIGLEATNDSIHAVWTDLRSQPPRLFHAELTQQTER